MATDSYNLLVKSHNTCVNMLLCTRSNSLDCTHQLEAENVYQLNTGVCNCYIDSSLPSTSFTPTSNFSYAVYYHSAAVAE